MIACRAAVVIFSWANSRQWGGYEQGVKVDIRLHDEGAYLPRVCGGNFLGNVVFLCRINMR